MGDRFATLAARAALGGIVVHKLESDNGRPLFIATKWALTKSFDTLDELQSWLDRLHGVKAA